MPGGREDAWKLKKQLEEITAGLDLDGLDDAQLAEIRRRVQVVNRTAGQAKQLSTKDLEGRAAFQEVTDWASKLYRDVQSEETRRWQAKGGASAATSASGAAAEVKRSIGDMLETVFGSQRRLDVYRPTEEMVRSGIQLGTHERQRLSGVGSSGMTPDEEGLWAELQDLERVAAPEEARLRAELADLNQRVAAGAKELRKERAAVQTELGNLLIDRVESQKEIAKIAGLVEERKAILAGVEAKLEAQRQVNQTFGRRAAALKQRRETAAAREVPGGSKFEQVAGERFTPSSGASRPSDYRTSLGGLAAVRESAEAELGGALRALEEQDEGLAKSLRPRDVDVYPESRPSQAVGRGSQIAQVTGALREPPKARETTVRLRAEEPRLSGGQLVRSTEMADYKIAMPPIEKPGANAPRVMSVDDMIRMGIPRELAAESAASGVRWTHAPAAPKPMRQGAPVGREADTWWRNRLAQEQAARIGGTVETSMGAPVVRGPDGTPYVFTRHGGQGEWRPVTGMSPGPAKMPKGREPVEALPIELESGEIMGGNEILLESGRSMKMDEETMAFQLRSGMTADELRHRQMIEQLHAARSPEGRQGMALKLLGEGVGPEAWAQMTPSYVGEFSGLLRSGQVAAAGGQFVNPQTGEVVAGLEDVVRANLLGDEAARSRVGNILTALKWRGQRTSSGEPLLKQPPKGFQATSPDELARIAFEMGLVPGEAPGVKVDLNKYTRPSPEALGIAWHPPALPSLIGPGYTGPLGSVASWAHTFAAAPGATLGYAGGRVAAGAGRLAAATPGLVKGGAEGVLFGEALGLGAEAAGLAGDWAKGSEVKDLAGLPPGLWNAILAYQSGGPKTMLGQGLSGIFQTKPSGWEQALGELGPDRVNRLVEQVIKPGAGRDELRMLGMPGLSSVERSGGLQSLLSEGGISPWIKQLYRKDYALSGTEGWGKMANVNPDDPNILQTLAPWRMNAPTAADRRRGQYLFSGGGYPDRGTSGLDAIANIWEQSGQVSGWEQGNTPDESAANMMAMGRFALMWNLMDVGAGMMLRRPLGALGKAIGPRIWTPGRAAVPATATTAAVAARAPGGLLGGLLNFGRGLGTAPGATLAGAAKGIGGWGAGQAAMMGLPLAIEAGAKVGGVGVESGLDYMQLAGQWLGGSAEQRMSIGDYLNSAAVERLQSANVPLGSLLLRPTIERIQQGLGGRQMTGQQMRAFEQSMGMARTNVGAAVEGRIGPEWAGRIRNAPVLGGLLGAVGLGGVGGEAAPALSAEAQLEKDRMYQASRRQEVQARVDEINREATEAADLAIQHGEGTLFDRLAGLDSDSMQTTRLKLRDYAAELIASSEIRPVWQKQGEALQAQYVGQALPLGQWSAAEQGPAGVLGGRESLPGAPGQWWITKEDLAKLEKAYQKPEFLQTLPFVQGQTQRIMGSPGMQAALGAGVVPPEVEGMISTAIARYEAKGATPEGRDAQLIATMKQLTQAVERKLPMEYVNQPPEVVDLLQALGRATAEPGVLRASAGRTAGAFGRLDLVPGMGPQLAESGLTPADWQRLMELSARGQVLDEQRAYRKGYADTGTLAGGQAEVQALRDAQEMRLLLKQLKGGVSIPEGYEFVRTLPDEMQDMAFEGFKDISAYQKKMAKKGIAWQPPEIPRVREYVPTADEDRGHGGRMDTQSRMRAEDTSRQAAAVDQINATVYESQARSAAAAQAAALSKQMAKIVEADVKELGGAFQKMLGGMFQPTSVTKADLDATKRGTYRDKWDEYNRRLRDVYNKGGGSPWQGMVPADVMKGGEAAYRPYILQQMYDFKADLPKAYKEGKVSLQSLADLTMDPYKRAMMEGDVDALQKMPVNMSKITPEFIGQLKTDAAAKGMSVDFVDQFVQQLKAQEAQQKAAEGLGGMLLAEPAVQKIRGSATGNMQLYVQQANAYLKEHPLAVQFDLTNVSTNLGNASVKIQLPGGEKQTAEQYAAGQPGRPTGPQEGAAAAGGIVLPKPGGRLVRVAEAGQAEAIIPLGRLSGLTGQGGGAGGGLQSVTYHNTFQVGVLSGQSGALRDLARRSAAEQAWQARRLMAQRR